MAERFNPTNHEPDPTAWAETSGTYSPADLPSDGRTIPLRREELVARKEMHHMGDVEVRTEVEEVPGRIEVQAQSEEVEVEHVPVGRVVAEREAPYQDGDVLVVPVYEEQLVVSKRLILREELRVKRVPFTETQVFEDTLRRERLVVEDVGHTGALRERYPTDDVEGARHEGFLKNIRRKVMQP